MPELAQAADGLHPAEDLFHEFSFPLTHVIARMCSCTDHRSKSTDVVGVGASDGQPVGGAVAQSGWSRRTRARSWR